VTERNYSLRGFLAPEAIVWIEFGHGCYKFNRGVRKCQHRILNVMFT